MRATPPLLSASPLCLSPRLYCLPQPLNAVSSHSPFSAPSVALMAANAPHDTPAALPKNGSVLFAPSPAVNVARAASAERDRPNAPFPAHPATISLSAVPITDDAPGTLFFTPLKASENDPPATPPPAPKKLHAAVAKSPSDATGTPHACNDSGGAELMPSSAGAGARVRAVLRAEAGARRPHRRGSAPTRPFVPMRLASVDVPSGSGATCPDGCQP